MTTTGKRSPLDISRAPAGSRRGITDPGNTVEPSNPGPAQPVDSPPAGDLRKMMKEQPLPNIPKDLIDLGHLSNENATWKAEIFLFQLNTALRSGDASSVEDCFYAPQAYWKDLLALTWHFRTFTSAGSIAAALLELKKLRGLDGLIEMDGDARPGPPHPTLVRQHTTGKVDVNLGCGS